MRLDPTLDLAEACRSTWDYVVVGAGPAGALAARELARRNKTVLLVDKSRFPRPKVCGCCLNLRAMAALSAVGLADLVSRRGAKPLQNMRLGAGGRQAHVAVTGYALSRETLDAALVEEAIRAGAHFLPETFARLGAVAGNARTLFLRRDGSEATAAARIVLGADGLGGRLLVNEPHHRVFVDSASRLGAGVIAEDFPDSYQNGCIFMACAEGGYVGLVRLEDNRLNAAAAFDGGFVKRAGGMGKAAAAILAEAGFPSIPGLDALPWHGTPLLSRSIHPPAGDRVFLLGDAAGYIEPFTGEGMAWALGCTAAVLPLALQSLNQWDPAYVRRWSLRHRHLIARRQWVCRAVANVLRRPRLVRLIVPALAYFPGLAAPMVRYLNQH